MPKYIIQSIYKAQVVLEVEVAEGQDPNCPANWNILNEDEIDYNLWDHEDAELIEEDNG